MNPIQSLPFAYSITFRTYASWLHGNNRESVDPRHNIFFTPRIRTNSNLEKRMRSNCNEPLFLLSSSQRTTVLNAIVDTCAHAGWHLYAAHVRTNHVHIILQTACSPDKAAISLKAYATRYLKKANANLLREHYWARGQSTKPFFDSTRLFRAMQYVIEEQGEKMALYYDREFYDTGW